MTASLGTVQVPLKLSVGAVTDAVVGTIELDLTTGTTPDWRTPLARALREIADDIEATGGTADGAQEVTA